MKKMFVAAVAVAAGLGVGVVALNGALAEQGLSAKETYDRALNDCQQLDNPDRRQQCRDKATQQFEHAQKSGMKHDGMEKKKQY